MYSRQCLPKMAKLCDSAGISSAARRQVKRGPSWHISLRPWYSKVPNALCLRWSQLSGCLLRWWPWYLADLGRKIYHFDASDRDGKHKRFMEVPLANGGSLRDFPVGRGVSLRCGVSPDVWGVRPHWQGGHVNMGWLEVLELTGFAWLPPFVFCIFSSKRKSWTSLKEDFQILPLLRFCRPGWSMQPRLTFAPPYPVQIGHPPDMMDLGPGKAALNWTAKVPKTCCISRDAEAEYHTQQLCQVICTSLLRIPKGKTATIIMLSIAGTCCRFWW